VGCVSLKANVAGDVNLPELDLHQVIDIFFITKYQLAKNRQLY
jgi:hypothetical protein